MQVSRPRITGPISVGHGVNEFFSIVIPPVVPLLVADLEITYGQAGFLLTIFFIMYSIFQLPAGMIADWVGKKRLLIAGLFGMSGGIVLASLATSYWMLLLAQAIAGISGSTFHPTGMSIISDVETNRTEGKAMGVFGFGGVLGTLSSPLIVGGLAAVAGWRVALVGAVVFGSAMTLVLVYLFSDADDDAVGLDRVTGRQLPSVRDGISAVGELLSVPISRSLVILFFVTLVLSLQHRAIQTFTTAYVTEQTGASVSTGNVTFFALLLGGSVASLWAGSLADRFNRELLGIVAAVVTAVLVGTTLLVTRLLSELPFGFLIAVLSVWFAVMGMSMYASYPVKNALISEQADAAYSGSLFGIIQTASALGSASGPALFGVLATRWGVIAAFPAIAGVSVVLALLFALLRQTD